MHRTQGRGTPQFSCCKKKSRKRVGRPPVGSRHGYLISLLGTLRTLSEERSLMRYAAGLRLLARKCRLTRRGWGWRQTEAVSRVDRLTPALLLGSELFRGSRCRVLSSLRSAPAQILLCPGTRWWHLAVYSEQFLFRVHPGLSPGERFCVPAFPDNCRGDLRH